ncbi:MAG: helix-turn-helix domain-containing protein [Algibacter sp.]|nr:helix-turn-helix domain-containing protein [Algibacter sp.]MDG2177303.1 helix-turn-helix domain-containing protein [Algibacter sp.]
MGMTSNLKIKESISSLEAAFKSSDNFKVRQRIQSLIFLKQGKFQRQADLAEYLGVDRSSLKRWIRQYKDTGLDGLTTLKSGGNYKGVISEVLHKALAKKMNDSQDPLLGYWHAVSWVKEHFGEDIHYQTLRSYLIRHFKTKKKHPRKSHYKKDEQALEVFKKTP